MNVGLVEPTDLGACGNPGWHMITEGIRWLITRAMPDTTFTYVSMHTFDTTWEMAEQCCDAVVVCGNPRFSMSAGNAFWEHEMWSRLHALHLHGVRIIDGWAGSAFPFVAPPVPVDEMATALMYMPGRLDYLNVAKQFAGHITRDATMQRIYTRAGLPSVLLPCSSWWAASAFGVTRKEPQYDVIVMHYIPDYGALPRIHPAARPLRVVAVDRVTYNWAKKFAPEIEFISDTRSLLHLFARAGRVLSFRLHSAIPAASVGCEVCAVRIDSRTDACALFDIPVADFTDLTNLAYRRATPPDTELATRTLATMLQP